jgi:hypothetical protein
MLLIDDKSLTLNNLPNGQDDGSGGQDSDDHFPDEEGG